MSTTTVFAITCNEPDCEELYVGAGHDTEDVARHVAQKIGGWGERCESADVWLDFCPDHTPTT